MTILLRMLNLGSGPARMRARLRRDTHALRAGAALLRAARAQTARAAAAALPPSLVGGGLLEVLSEPLRGLLSPGAPEAPGEALSPARGRLNAPDGGSARPGRQSGPLLGASPLATPPFGVPPLGVPPPPGAAVAGSRAPFIPPAGGNGSAAGGLITGRERAGGPAAHSPSPLEKALAAYFRPAGVDPAASGPAPAAAHALSPAQNAPRTALPGLAPGADGRGWPALTGDQLAERLRAFAAGGAAEERGAPARADSARQEAVRQEAVRQEVVRENAAGQEGVRRTAVHQGAGQEAAGAGESAAVAVYNTFHIHPGQAAFPDLSDQVAEILRRQAVEHGIDVT